MERKGPGEATDEEGWEKYWYRFKKRRRRVCVIDSLTQLLCA